MLRVKALLTKLTVLRIQQISRSREMCQKDSKSNKEVSLILHSRYKARILQYLLKVVSENYYFIGTREQTKIPLRF